MNLKKMADAAARRYGIPPSLFRRLIQQESGWNPDVRNPASGATGLVQIHLPSHPDVSEAQARDPAFALGWGARYLAAQKARFGRWDLALAAYNAGASNVENGRWKSFPETRNYVREILAGASTKAPPVSLPAAPVARAPKLGVPAPPNPGLLASLLQSNNEMIGIGTPAPLLDLLTRAQQPTVKPEGFAGLPYDKQASVPLSAPEASHGHVSGFVPAFEAALNKLLKATGLTVNSGYRSNERQAELFAAAVRKYGSEAAARKWVAPPGKSKHNHGVAADLGGNLSVLNDALLRKYGLYRPMQWEPWHVELIGSRG
jgi:hypothetical protein